MRGRVLVAGLALALVGVASLAFAETMYARTSVKVRAEKKLSSDVVAELEQGDPVQTLQKLGRHYRVRIGEKEGWVYYNKLTAEQPEDLTLLLTGATGTVEVELTEIEAGGALRGLSPMAKKYAENEDIPAWALQAVENMQSLKLSDKELDAFAREGGLGEYGEE